jgi:N6-L-threonylcarbamoyladenine synthase
MKILGIETSCDETAAAVIEGKRGKVKVLSNVVSSQIEIHKKYGGVVPEVAAREHVLNILPVVNEALLKTGIKREDAPKKIDVISVTIGPGLITSLLVGIETAKVLSYAWNVPVIAVNHTEGHIYANFIGVNSKFQIPNSKLFPSLILTVSGGHTMLILMRGHGKYKIIGETRDDAAGEAFDKAAAMLGIGYPGGPAIAKLAEKSDKTPPRPPLAKGGNIQIKERLPRPMINSKNYDFSFSGLKTALFYELQKDAKWKKRIPEYCYEFQQAVIDVLIAKTIKAAKEYKVKTIMMSGGVSANLELRRQMTEAIKFQIPNSKFQIPNLKYTTDNAAMIAAAGYFKALRKKFTLWQKLEADCNAEL